MIKFNPDLFNIFEWFRKQAVKAEEELEELKDKVDQSAFALAQAVYGVEIYHGACLGASPEYDRCAAEYMLPPYPYGGLVTLESADARYDLADVNMDGERVSIPLHIAIAMRLAYIAEEGAD